MAVSTPVKRWIVCETGFGQDESRVTGVESLQDEVHRLCSCADTRCVLKSWRDSPSSLAQRIKNRAGGDEDPTIVVIGYSWGGYSSVLLCRELQKRDLSVEHLLLCDAVWRSKFMIGYPLSLTDWLTISIPGNVRNLYSWRQTANIPCGAKIKLEEPYDEKTNQGTKHVLERVLPHVTHEHIDEHREFLRVAKSVACPKSAAANL